MKLRTWCIRMGQILTKTVLVFTGFLISLTLFNPAITKAENNWGGITIRQQNVPIEKVFQSIEKQSGYRFFYNETLLQGAGKVTINLQNVSLQEALEACFQNQPLSYAIVDKTIIVKRRPEQQPKAPELAAVSASRPGKIIALRGKVTSNKVPVPDASIMVKGTDNGAKSDKDGMFTLPEVEDDATLVISTVSHQPREVRLTGQTFINIDLSTKTSDLDEALVVAYSTTTRKMNTGAVAVVKGEEIASLPNRSFDKSLQGFVPGLLVTSGTGQPGAGTSNFVLRGIATSASANNGSTIRNPLIVIDGVPVSQETAQLYTDVVRDPVINNPLAQLNPSDIETISILKDASAIALYGAKSSNGVILITTKKGKAGKTRFNFRHQTDVASATDNKQKLLSQDEYLELLFETYRNTPKVVGGVTIPWTDADIYTDLRKKFPYIVNAPGDTSFYETPDWESALYRNAATTISNELSMTGGSEKTNFYLNFEYTKQNGVVKKTGLDRKSIRFNFENRPTGWLKIGMNSTFSYTVQNYGGALRQGGNDAASYALEMSPLNPIRYLNGDFVLNYAQGGGGTRSNIANPVAAMEYNNINRNTAFRGLSKIYADVDFLKHFRFSTILGIDFMLSEAKEKADPRLEDPEYRTGGRVEERNTRRSNLISTNILRYSVTLAQDHLIEVLGGQESQILYNKTLSVGVRGLTSPYYDQITSPGVTVFRQDGYALKETLLSYFGQANYGFKNRYFLTGSIRRDGSSRFGEDKRFGTYWSTGAGWVINSEPFMQWSNNWLDYFKIRGSIGAAGNAGAIDRFTPYDRVQIAGYLGNPAVLPSGSNAGNSDVKWERTFTWDAGLELRFLKQRINITADIYRRNTSDLIYSVSIPSSSGSTNTLANIGKMTNNGIELSLSVDIIRNHNFRWNITGNWSTNKNKLTKANKPEVISNGSNVTASKEGESFDAFYLRTWAGVSSADGSPMWLDSTDTPNSNYNSAKLSFVGKSQPDGFGSVTNTFSYKRVELSAMLYYQYGGLIYNAAMMVRDGFAPYSNETTQALDRWRKPGDNATNPKRVLNNASPLSKPSTRFLFNDDHIRLQYARIGYTLSENMIKQIHLSSVRVFVQGNNLALWTRNADRDPAGTNVGGYVDYRYPSQRTMSIGLNVIF